MFAALMTPAAWLAAIMLFSRGVTAWIVLPVMAVGGALFTMFDVLWSTSIARFIPPHALSRGSSYCWLVPSAFMPVGFLAAGALGTSQQ